MIRVRIVVGDVIILFLTQIVINFIVCPQNKAAGPTKL
jgi:hypothetical protein